MRKPWKPTKNEEEIIRINREAQEVNLTYGQYVARYGGGANVRGKGKKVPTASRIM